MSAYWIAEKLREAKNDVEVNVVNKSLLEITVSPLAESAKVYVVNNEYFLDIDVVARAFREGASHIAYFEITRPTTAGDEFAAGNGIQIWPVGKFISAAKRGKL